MTHKMPKAMLVNVGGATAPAIHTLNEQRPEFICFFVSPDSRPLIREKIIPALNYTPEHFDWIETKIPQSLQDCYKALVEKLPAMLEKWGLTSSDLFVEYTAGTKSMSVAAVLATIESSSKYFYVGARDPSGRDKNGIGVVLDGREYTWFEDNPWEVMAVSARKEIALLFNHGRFADAKERAEHLAQVVPENMRKVYEALAELIDGYALWDRFDYRLAQVKLYKALTALRLYAAGTDDPVHFTLDVVEANADFLRRLNEKSEQAQHLDVMDMLANAARRADVAQKYDDAVARLYSVLEALARNRLLSQYKIKTGAVRVDQIPETIRAEYMRLYSDPGAPDTDLRLGLQASYNLLAALNDELGNKYVEYEKELNQVLLARNQSRLAHGTTPVSAEIYVRMRQIILSFAQVGEDELPKFPEMKL